MQVAVCDCVQNTLLILQLTWRWESLKYAGTVITARFTSAAPRYACAVSFIFTSTMLEISSALNCLVSPLYSTVEHAERTLVTLMLLLHSKQGWGAGGHARWRLA